MLQITSALFLLSLIMIGCVREKETPFANKIDAYFTNQFPNDEPGGAVLVMKGDSVVFAKGYGLADLNTKEAITTKTLFNLGSISKTFVANAILILEEQGKLSVEDSLIKYFSGFKNKNVAKEIKIKHLLTHTSGLPDNREVSKDTAFYLTAKDAENWYPVTQTDNLEFEPGAQYNYSNPAFNGLALIVEQVSGIKWQKFVQENIFVPSGMVASTITDGSHPDHGVSHAYIKKDGRWIEDDYGEEPTFPAAGNGGVWSSVEELARYERAIRHNLFLSEEKTWDSRTVKRFRNWSSKAEPFIGWSWHVTKQDSISIIGHPGSQGGFLTNYITLPGKEIFFVILCNTPREEYEMKKTLTFVLEQVRKQNWLSNE